MSESITISRPESSSGAPFLNLNRYSENIAATLTATLLLVLLLAVALWPMVAHDALLGWSMLVCAVQAGQTGLAHRYLNMDAPIEPRVWKGRFLALAVVSGIVWGTPFIAFGLTAHDPAFFALLFAIAGVTAYGGMAKLPVLSIALTFEAVVLLPLSAWLFLQGGTIPEFMGIAVLLYLAMLSLLFRQTSVVAAQRHSLQAHKKELGSLRQDSDQRMGRFLECVPGVFVTLRRDRDGVMTVPFARGSSPAFEGLDPKAIAESIAPLLALCHPEDTAPLLAELHASAQEMRPCHAEFRIGAASPGERVMELTAQPQQGAEPGVIEWHGVMQDITERRRLEEQLKMKSHALDHSSEAHYLIGEQWQFVYANDKACQQLGYSREELLALSLPDISPGFDLPRVQEQKELVLDLGIIVFETEHKRRDGSTFPVEIQTSCVEYNGQLLGMCLVRDITERKAVEKSLREGEAMLQEAQRIAHVGSWDVDMLNDKLTWSDETFRIWEIDKTKFKADFAAFLETVHPEDRERVNRVYYESVANHTLYEVEHRLLFPDGRIKHILERGEPQYDAEGKPVRFIGTSLEITERKQMEVALAQREREFRSLAENMPDNIARWDTEGRYLYVNPTHERLLGMKQEDLVGLSIPDSHAHVKAGIMQVVASGQALPTLRQTAMVDGEEQVHEVTLAPEFDASGKVVSVLGLGRNMTAIYRMQETIAAREREFRSLAESAPDNIVRYDREGRCLYLNEKLSRQLGLNSMDEAIGKRPSEVWPDGRFSKLEETAAHVVASGERAEIELTEPDGKGGWLHHWISVVPELDARGDIIGTIAFGRDISERKRMETALAAHVQEFRSLAESAPDNIVRYDKDGRHRYLSQQLVRQLGLASAEEALGKRPSEVWPDGRFSQLEEAAAQVISSGERAELELAEPNGKENWLHHWISIVPELDADGEIIGTIAFGRDISERKQMEQALAEREAFLGTLLDAISIPVFYKDRQGRYLGINHAFEQYFGAERENLVGKSVFDTHPKELAEVYHAKDMEVFERRVERQEYEFRVKHSNGSLREVMFSKAAFTDANGEVKGLIGAVMDITERKQSEIKLQERLDQIVELNDLLSENARQLEEQATELEASQEQLKETEAWYRGILHSAPDGMIVIDDCGRIVFVNEELERMFGYPHGELLGQPLEVLLPAELRNAHVGLRNGYFGNASKSDLPGQNRNLRACRKNGAEFVVDVSLSRLPANDYNPGAICAAVRDVTERRRGEQEVAETRNRLKSVLHTIPDLVWMKNTEGEYLACNPAFERFFGAGEAEIIGKTDHDFVEAELADFFRQKDMEAIDSATMRVNEEWVTFASDGKRALLETRKVPVLDAQGKTTGVLGVARDITDIKAAELRYKQALEFSESVLNAIPDLLFEFNGEGRYLNIWAQRPELLAAPKEALLGRTIYDVLPPDAAEICNSALQEAMANRISLGKTFCLDLPHGTEWFELSVSRKSGGAESDPHFLAISRNVTERKRLELEVAKREHEFRTLVENAADTVARYGKDLRRLYANPAFAELVEGGVDALLGKKPSEVPGGSHADVYEEKLVDVMATGEEIEFELRWTDKSGRELCSLINLTPEFGKDGTVETVLAVGRDISELYAFRQKIHQMAFYDTLTTLPNRALFSDRLRQMIADASWHHQLGGVMMLDMDRFKEINDTMGHAVGDELLREAGARLTACVRSYDTVARLGGDEFAVLLPDVRHGDDIGRIADKMRSAFDRPFLLAGKEVFVTCSIGIALYPDDSTEADDLLRYADSAMYFAKRSGRNAFRFYSRDLTESANERLMLESELRRAVERGELEVYYQPKVRLSDGALIGSEALLRWKHPQRGMIPPDKFIPIAEDSGLIIEIGEWVLRESCRAAAAMNGAGKPAHKVAINLSARQFQTGDLLAVVSQVLDETHCRPEWIELEITESLLLDEDGRVLEVLRAFRSLGITVAIDDFGTGYSALSYLARFPITTLKIDRSFVSRIDTDSFRAELVKAILSIAHCLGQEVVAEGVETAGQAAFLTAHGCQVAQGYLFSKPVPMVEFVALPEVFKIA